MHDDEGQDTHRNPHRDEEHQSLNDQLEHIAVPYCALETFQKRGVV